MAPWTEVDKQIKEWEFTMPKKWQGTNSYRIYKEVLQINNKKVTIPWEMGKGNKQVNAKS